MSEKLVRATVARGRSVMKPDASRKRLAGYSDKGEPRYTPELVQYGPGQEVDLPADEVKTLRQLGFLIDPGAVVHPIAEADSNAVGWASSRGS